MKYLYIFLLLLVTACNPIYTAVAPGSPLPKGFIAGCTGWDVIGRCTSWTSESDQCVNPKGINEPNPVVPCADIKSKNTK